MRHPMKPRVYSLVLVLSLCCPGVLCGQPEQGKSISIEPLGPKEGVRYDEASETLTDEFTRCSMRFPSAPDSKLTRVPTPHGVMMIRSQALDVDGLSVVMTQTKHPPALLKAMGVDAVNKPGEFLQMACDGALARRKDAKVHSRRPISLQESPGIEQAVTYPAGTTVADEYPEGVSLQRTYFRHGLLYVVMVDVSKNDYQADVKGTKQRIIEFLDSFAFINPKNP